MQHILHVFLYFLSLTFQVLTEYVLISVTSAVTVTIAGIVKEAVTILVRTLLVTYLPYFLSVFSALVNFLLFTSF